MEGRRGGTGTDVDRSKVTKILRRLGLNRLKALDPPADCGGPSLRSHSLKEGPLPHRRNNLGRNDS
jgi:hypothetical protein